MAIKALLFDLEYCVGCHACTIACRQENDFTDENMVGIKVAEHSYPRRDGGVQVDFVPFVTVNCNLCAGRIASGFDTKPSCVKHCMTKCIEYGDWDELAEKAKKMKRPMLCEPN